MLSKSGWSGMRRWRHSRVATFRWEWVNVPSFAWMRKRLLASFVFCKICFVRLSAPLTMNSSVWPYETPQDLACALEKYDRMRVGGSGWRLGRFEVCLKATLESSATLLGASWAPLGHCWMGFATFKIDLGRLLGPLGRVKVILNGFWNDFGAKMKPKISFQGDKKNFEMGRSFMHVFKHENLILNNPPMKIDHSSRPTDSETG